MSNMIDLLVVDAHNASLMMGDDIVAKCETKALACEIAEKVNSYDKLTEQNKMLREALEVLREATEHLVDDSLVLFMRDGRKLNLDMVYDLVDTALKAEM